MNSDRTREPAADGPTPLGEAGSLRGLTEAEASAALERCGPNELPQPRTRPALRRLLQPLVHFMALLLWAAGGLAMLSKAPELAWAIWLVILVNAAFTYWQDFKAESALAELRKILPIQCKVYRGGELRVMPARILVPGDLILLEDGDRVPADAVLVPSASLSIDASTLTGESHPLVRTSSPESPSDLPITENPNIVPGGTTIVSGRGVARVMATGAGTALGKVSRLTSEVRREPSTLEIEVARIVRLITTLAVGMGAATFLVVYLLLGIGALESLLFAIGIIVANVPEGLLPIVTLSLAIGVRRMARKKVLVRRLSAIETLSATTVICTDKTGTLTRNEMTLSALWVPFRSLTGETLSRPSEFRSPEKRLLAAAALCSNARIADPSSSRSGSVIGDPTEAAFVTAAAAAGLDRVSLEKEWPRLREIPFEARRKLMTVAVDATAGFFEIAGSPCLAITKGAPEEILGRSRQILEDGKLRAFSEEDRAQAGRVVESFAREGMRVLGVAIRPLSRRELEGDPSSIEADLTLVGFLALRDPPRPGVKEALEQCRRAGIRVTLVTGDDGVTAEAIGREVGLVGAEAKVVTGREMERLSQPDLRNLLQETRDLIFARITPEGKLRLVEGYKDLGHVVAVTGDGVNDAPALRSAHVGIAMGKGGTDAAREAADIVLVDDHFATIVAAIEQGRAIYRNIRKFLAYVLASNVPEIVPYLAMVAFKIPPALNILQMLAVDLGTDIVPALSLGADPPEPGILDQAPRSKKEPLLDWRLLARAYGFLGLIEAAVSMLAFFWVFWRHGYSLADLRHFSAAILGHRADPGVMAVYREATGAALAAIVACQIGNVFACRTERGSIFKMGLPPNRIIFVGIAVEVALLLAILYLPALQGVFGTLPPSVAMLFALLLAAPLLLALEELRKRWVSRHR